MHKKIMIALVALTAFAAPTIVPAMAQAEAVIYEAGGAQPLEVETPVEMYTDFSYETSGGYTFVCPVMEIKAEVIENPGAAIEVTGSNAAKCHYAGGSTSWIEPWVPAGQVIPLSAEPYGQNGLFEFINMELDWKHLLNGTCRLAVQAESSYTLEKWGLLSDTSGVMLPFSGGSACIDSKFTISGGIKTTHADDSQLEVRGI